MTNKLLREELHLLLDLSFRQQDEEAFVRLIQSASERFDWHYFLERAISTNLAGYLLPHSELAKAHYPGFVFEKLKAYQQRIQLHSTLLREWIFELIPLFEAARIPYALLKGWDLHFRGGMSLKERQISDIDLLVEAQQLTALEKRLKENGYVVQRHVYKSKYHERYLVKHAPLTVFKGQLMLDIHTRTFSKEHGIHFNVHLEKRQAFAATPQSVYLLDKEEAALFGLLHFAKHFRSKQALKIAMMRDLPIFLEMLDLESPRIRPYLVEIGRIRGLLKAIETKQFDTSKRYDEVFLRNLQSKKATFKGKVMDLYVRFKPKTGLETSITLAFFDVFPSKAFLEHQYGSGPYVLLCLLRFQKAFDFSKRK